MKKLTNLLTALGIAALLNLAIGCSTTRQSEDMLTSAGFKRVPATSPQQLKTLGTLPAGKVTKVQRDGKTYFVYPDSAHSVLYVGQQAQFNRWQGLMAKQAQASQQVEAYSGLDPASLDYWQNWQGWGAFQFDN